MQNHLIVRVLTGICENFQRIRTFSQHPLQFPFVFQEISVLRENTQGFIHIKLRFHPLNSIAGMFHKEAALQFHKARNLGIALQKRLQCILRLLEMPALIIRYCFFKNLQICLQLCRFRGERTCLFPNLQQSFRSADLLLIHKRKHCRIKILRTNLHQHRMIKFI